MSMPGTWTRRSVLRTFGWLATIAAVRPFAAVVHRIAGRRTDYPPIDVRTLFRQPKSAAFLGRLYLEQRPAEQSIPVLHELIWSECTDEEKQAARIGTASMQQILNSRAVRDFACGQTIVLDGWVLSRTEARLYALAALSA